MKVKMKKTKVLKDDGRYLVYYEFEDDETEAKNGKEEDREEPREKGARKS